MTIRASRRGTSDVARRNSWFRRSGHRRSVLCLISRENTVHFRTRMYGIGHPCELSGALVKLNSVFASSSQGQQRRIYVLGQAFFRLARPIDVVRAGAKDVAVEMLAL